MSPVAAMFAFACLCAVSPGARASQPKTLLDFHIQGKYVLFGTWPLEAEEFYREPQPENGYVVVADRLRRLEGVCVYDGNAMTATRRHGRIYVGRPEKARVAVFTTRSCKTIVGEFVFVYPDVPVEDLPAIKDAVDFAWHDQCVKAPTDQWARDNCRIYAPEQITSIRRWQDEGVISVDYGLTTSLLARKVADHYVAYGFPMNMQQFEKLEEKRRDNDELRKKGPNYEKGDGGN